MPTATKSVLKSTMLLIGGDARRGDMFKLIKKKPLFEGLPIVTTLIKKSCILNKDAAPKAICFLRRILFSFHFYSTAVVFFECVRAKEIDKYTFCLYLSISLARSIV